MGVLYSQVTGAGGVVYIEHRDVDTGALLRRFRAPEDQQAAKVRLELQAEELYDDWKRWSDTYDVVNAMTDVQFAALTGLPQAGRALAVAALLARRNGSLGDYLIRLNEWRQAT